MKVALICLGVGIFFADFAWSVGGFGPPMGAPWPAITGWGCPSNVSNLPMNNFLNIQEEKKRVQNRTVTFHPGSLFAKWPAARVQFFVTKNSSQELIDHPEFDRTSPDFSARVLDITPGVDLGAFFTVDHPVYGNVSFSLYVPYGVHSSVFETFCSPSEK